MATKRIRIADLNHHVSLCSAKDVVIDGGTMVIVREDVTKAWVKIEPKQASMFSQAGYAIQEPRDRQTHIITMRMRRDLDISSAAWVYEQRLQSGARWFKVLGIRDADDCAEFMILSAKLIERGDDLVAPADPGDSALIKQVDHGVKL